MPLGEKPRELTNLFFLSLKCEKCSRSGGGGAMTAGITTLGIMTLSIMTLSIAIKNIKKQHLASLY